MVRDRHWKYVWNATAADELYDLENDTGEITNLGQNSKYKNELQRLRNRLIYWMEVTQDRHLNQWIQTQIKNGLKK